MEKSISRREGLKLTVAGLTAGALTGTGKAAGQSATASVLKSVTADSWGQRFDRVWLGREFWANPMEDWSIVNGAAECGSTGGNRSVHSLPHQLVDPTRPFRTIVTVKRLQTGGNDGGAAIRIGSASEIGEYRSNCFVQSGIDSGVVGNRMVVGSQSRTLSGNLEDQEFELELTGTPRQVAYELQLVVRSTISGAELGRLSDLVWPDAIRGNIAVVSNFTMLSDAKVSDSGTRYRFSNWRIEGAAFCDAQSHCFGPILWAMYTLSDSRGAEGHVLKITALTGPMGAQDTQEVELHVKTSGKWRKVGAANLDTDAWTATLRIPNWDARHDTPYRLVYRETLRDGKERPDYFEGTIKADPQGRTLRMAALTCQNDYAFPYEPVANNVARLDPDLILFSGDQIYEDHGGYGLVRAPADRAILNYLRKFYQFGWAFREAMRHAPTVCLPDDHDIFQGNFWGEGGAPFTEAGLATGRSDTSGGYIQPARMVNAVHRTNTSHLPEPVDPTPVQQGISVYFTEMVYGNVSFAILADRQWKTGPDKAGIVVGVTGQDETPLSINPKLDGSGLELLGDRQERFLDHWADDWRGHTLKAVLSQTVFAGISTHQPEPDAYLKYDFDSSGWPHEARNRAVRLLAKASALHICGDTHLGTLSQYGVDKQRDSAWAFCTPAIAAGWPRWWLPEKAGLPCDNRPKHGLPNTGEYVDAFGNKIYVYAVGNPAVGTATNRYLKAQQKGSGFGFIEFDTASLTYRMSAYRFLADLSGNGPGDQFAGWPVTISKAENAGINKLS